MGIRLVLTLAAWLTGTAALSAAEIKNSDCLECHSDKTLTSTNAAGVVRSVYADGAVVAASAHGKTSCASCHSDLTAKHPDDNVAAQPVNCSRCHEDESLSYGMGVHGEARIGHVHNGKHAAPQCIDCHGTHGILAAALPASPLHPANRQNLRPMPRTRAPRCHRKCSRPGAGRRAPGRSHLQQLSFGTQNPGAEKQLVTDDLTGHLQQVPRIGAAEYQI